MRMKYFKNVPKVLHKCILCNEWEMTTKQQLIYQGRHCIETTNICDSCVSFFENPRCVGYAMEGPTLDFQ